MKRNALVTLVLVALLATFSVQFGDPSPNSSNIVIERSEFWDASPGVSLRENIIEAQDFRGFSTAFTAQTAVGQTTGRGMRGIAAQHTIELITTGAPTGCTYRLQGSRDNVTWFNISAADITCTTSTVAFEANKPTAYVRGNLLTLAGGTAPTVTLKYIGR